LAIYRSSPLVAVARGAPPPGWVAVDGNPCEVFALLLKNVLDFLVAVRRLAVEYEPADAKNLGVWEAMRQAQKPLRPAE
jgi:hypothetical protein